MIEPALLSRAVAHGIISPAQSEALARLAVEDAPAASDPAQDDERLRFITGFADIFVTLGIALFLGAAWWIGSEALGAGAAWALVAALSWGLAEFFARRRRMALPSIVLLLVFCASAFRSARGLLGIDTAGAPLLLDPGSGIAAQLPYGAASAAALLAAILHYRRFAVPITIAAGTAALAGTLLALAFAALPGLGSGGASALIVLAGLGVFALAMRYDLADPLRLTRRADIAFWLHLLAAPMVVHPVLANLGADGRLSSAGTAALVLGLVLLLALVALATDRRAILVAGLTYAAYAVGTLIRQAGFTGLAGPLSLLALGAFVLLLSAGWHPLRGLVLRGLPHRFAARLPHPIGAR